MILNFEGLVQLGDECRVNDDEDENGAIFINGIDVVQKISETTFSHTVTIAIADERFTGDLDIEIGWGYSEWTPMDPDVLKVGAHDIIEILKRHAGEKIKMWVADEPVNVLE